MKTRKTTEIITRSLILLCLALILIVVTQATPKTAHRTAAPTQYVDSQAGFKITLPAGWEKVATQPGNVADFKSSHSIIIPHSNNYSPYIDVVSAPAQFPSLSALVNADVSGLSQQTNNFHLMSSTPETISGQPATLLVYSFSLQDTATPPLTNAQLVVVKGSTEYGVTGTALTSMWAPYSAAIKKALLSFQLNTT